MTKYFTQHKWCPSWGSNRRVTRLYNCMSETHFHKAEAAFFSSMAKLASHSGLISHPGLISHRGCRHIVKTLWL